MKAYVFTEKGKVELRELPAPVLDCKVPEDAYAAILKPKYLAPCSSDAHTVYAGPGPRRENLILGHEGLAEVVSTGEKVKDFHPGELVAVAAVMPEIPGGHGHEGAHFSATKLGRNIDGMWSELFKIPDADQNLIRIPEGVSPEAALMAVDMMATGYTAAYAALPGSKAGNSSAGMASGTGPLQGAFTETLRARKEDEPEWSSDSMKGLSVLVIGSGAVGLMAVAAAHSMGAEKIMCIGTPKNEINRVLAEKYGADIYISYRDGKILYNKDGKDGEPENDGEILIDERANASSDPAVDTVLRLTKGEGVDRILICGGGKDVYIQACDMLRYGSGIAVNVAYIEGTGTVELPIFSLGRGMAGKTFVFTLSKGGRTWVEKMFAEITDGRVDPGLLVTSHMQGFDRIPEALSAMHRRPGGLIKVMVEI